MKRVGLIIIILICINGVIIYGYFNSNYRVKVNKNEVSRSIFDKYYNKAISIVDGMSDEEMVGQLFIVHYNKNDVSYLSNFYPGGYLLFAKDFKDHSVDGMKSEIDKAQTLSKYPLLVATDEEGGEVTRVSRFTEYRSSPFLSPKEYYNEGGFSKVESSEREKAKLLLSVGVNLNLAPVADVSTNKDDFIYNRSFGENSDITSDYVGRMVDYSKSNHINSCLKHFPGYGNNTDTHTGSSIDTRSYSEISNNDYKPFEAGIREGVPCILVSHNRVLSIDSDYPASLSSKMVNELRDKLKYTGIILTDDLTMKAIKDNYNDASVLAINAGSDMLITSDFMADRRLVLDALKSGVIKRSTIELAVTRIIAWKYYSGLF